MDSKTYELIFLARSGDANAFGELYDMYSKEMYCYACAMVKNTDLAQDAVQDAAMTAFKEIKCLRNIESFKGWLFKILNVACRKQYKNVSETLYLIDEFNYNEDSDNSYTEEIEISELSMDLKSALSILTDEEKEIVLLRVVNEYSSREISEMFAIPDSTVRSKMKRSLEKLRAYMGTCERICA